MKALILSLVFASNLSHADVADEYEKYVRAVPALSKTLAKDDASIRELAILVDRLSVAQSHLAQASSAATMVAFYTTQMKALGENGCPRTKGEGIDVGETITEILSTSQVINYTHELKRHLESYRALETGSKKACTEEEQFKAYDTVKIAMPIYVPKDIGVIDGVYLVYAQGDRGRRDQSAGERNNGASGFEAVPVIGSIYQIGVNLSQNSRLKELRHNLYGALVKNEEYRQYAKQECERLVATSAKEAFATEAPLVEALEALAQGVEEKALLARRANLDACLNKYEMEVVEFFQSEATAIAEKRFSSELEEQRLGKLAVGLHTRINLSALELERARSCAEGWGVAGHLRRDLALLKVYLGHQNEEREFLEKKRAVLGEWQSSCEVRGQR